MKWMCIFPVVALVPLSLRAELVVYESFDYGHGQLVANDGGQGWMGGWLDAPHEVRGDESLESALGETPKVSGGHVVTTRGDWPAVRDLAEAFADKPGVYWLSLLAANPSGEREETYGQVSFVPLDGGGGGGVVFIKAFNAPNWSIQAGGQKAVTSSSALEEPVFAVLRVTIGEGEDTSGVAVFIDPDLGSEPVTPDAEVTGVSLGPIQRVSIRSGVGAKNFAFDEIRMGTTYESVAPKP